MAINGHEWNMNKILLMTIRGQFTVIRVLIHITDYFENIMKN